MAWDIVVSGTGIIDENGDIEANKTLFIKDGAIKKIAPAGENGENKEETGEKINAAGKFVTPGFVNLHTHSPMNIFKGIAEDVNINDWFNREIWPYESVMTENDAYYGSLAAICEMLACGVSAFADHYFFADKISEAILETGIKGEMAPTIFGGRDDLNEQLGKAEKVFEKWGDSSSRLKFRMGPHAPYTCPGESLQVIIEKAKDLGMGIHIHLSETKQQVEESIKTHGKTPFQILHEAGGFDLPLIIAHGIWMEEDDRQYINNDTFFALSPKTYMKMGMGGNRIWDDYKNLPLCMGTDGAASSNTLNPLEQARLFALLGKFITGQPEKFGGRDIWKMLMRGHKALSFNSGRIKEGYSADLLVWDLKNVMTGPLYNPLSSILYSSESKHIIHSIIDGRLVKKNGKLLFDCPKIYDALDLLSQDLLKRGKGKAKVIY